VGAVRTWSAAWQRDWARDIGRPRSDSDAVRVSAPREDSHRLNVTHTSAGLAGLRNLRLQAMAGRSRQ
jgi:hypothetical protein